MGLIPESRASIALERELRFAGRLAVAQCPRLASEVLDADAAVLEVGLQADRRNGWPRLHGAVDGHVTLECKRCGRAFLHVLHMVLDLRLVFSEDEERSALAAAEPLLVEDDRLPLRQIVEEEILLALPMLPRCESCENEVDQVLESSMPASEQETPAPRDNPFAALKRQLQSNRK